ncbi:MAG: hypothetical protein WCO82_12705 [Sphingomonadales bacterium]|jgi:hypothetical protein
MTGKQGMGAGSGLLIGLFVWIIFHNLALGILAGLVFGGGAAKLLGKSGD